MSGLTPEQIQEGKALLAEAQAAFNDIRDNTHTKARQSACETTAARWRAWLLLHASRLLAAAESVGKLEKLAESTPHRFTNAEELGPCDLCGCTGDDPIHRQSASLRARLAAREQENERMRTALREVIDDHEVWIEAPKHASSGWYECRFCAGTFCSDDCVMKRIGAALTPSVPPQTTETRG